MLYFVFWDSGQLQYICCFSRLPVTRWVYKRSPILLNSSAQSTRLIVCCPVNIIVILLFAFFPSLRTAPIGTHFSFLLSLTFLISGILWFLVSSCRITRSIRNFSQRESPEEKKTRLESAVQTLFGKDSEEKERLIAAFVLLNDRDNLTLDGKKSLVDVLTAVSGENFGTDYPKWEDWVMKQLMK
jgi:hypothetical protein